MKNFNLKDSGLAALVHLAISLMVAALVAWLIFSLWYPEPYDNFSGGRKLFFLLMSVDVILGPLLTFIAYSRSKSKWHMLGDFAVIGVLQLMALAYGGWTLYAARPVYLAFEIDRFRVVHAVNVSEDLLPLAPSGMQSLSLMGPELVAIRPFVGADEKAEATMAALAGVELAFRPDFWMPYEDARGDVLHVSKPLTDLLEKRPSMNATILQAMADAGLAADGRYRYLPVHARSEFWTVLLDSESAKPLLFLPIDPY